MDPDGSIRLQNRAAEHLLGPPPDTMEQRLAYWRRLKVPETRGTAMRNRELPPTRALRGGNIIGEELEIERPDGSLAVIVASAAPLRDQQGRITGVASAFQDITRLRELDRMKDEFVSVVSHELRTPLTAIRGSLQLLLADAAAIPDDDNRQLLGVALKSCERLVRIINDILDLSKIEAGQLALVRKPVSVHDLVQQSIESVQQIADQAGVRIVPEIPPGLPAVVADADRMTQALVNLLSNAVKFAPAGSPVTVAAREEDGVVALSVRDRGPGIAPQDLPRLFRKFHQLDGSPRSKGTGLGLAITKAIVEEHGGRASVESTLGQGTTFTVAIPCAATGAEALSALVPRRPSPPRVLIVDDDSSMRTMLRAALEVDGLRVIEAATGREAVERAREERPDAITLDLEMPEGDGWWVINELSGDPATAQIPVLIVTGTDADATGMRHPVVRKPFDTTDLIGNVSHLLKADSGRVLVADDDDDVRHVLSESLQRQGLTVIQAADGRQALELVESDRFDLVILDLDMPYVHGHDIIRALRNRNRDRRVPIIVMSGSSGERHSLKSLVLGASVFMMKPPDAPTLAREVERLLRQ
jgi:PAS domain S-box-containing protein